MASILVEDSDGFPARFRIGQLEHVRTGRKCHARYLNRCAESEEGLLGPFVRADDRSKEGRDDGHETKHSDNSHEVLLN